MLLNVLFSRKEGKILCPLKLGGVFLMVALNSIWLSVTLLITVYQTTQILECCIYMNVQCILAIVMTSISTASHYINIQTSQYLQAISLQVIPNYEVQIRHVKLRINRVCLKSNHPLLWRVLLLLPILNDISSIEVGQVAMKTIYVLIYDFAKRQIGVN